MLVDGKTPRNQSDANTTLTAFLLVQCKEEFDRFAFSTARVP